MIKLIQKNTKECKDMKKIADVKEISHNENHPSIIFAISAHESRYKEKILAYLKSGEIIRKGDEKFTDVINLKEIDHTPLYYCDGEYEWTTEEIHYAENYNLSLNEEFLLKIGIKKANTKNKKTLS